jgi:hypothetical protein
MIRLRIHGKETALRKRTSFCENMDLKIKENYGKFNPCFEDLDSAHGNFKLDCDTEMSRRRRRQMNCLKDWPVWDCCKKKLP